MLDPNPELNPAIMLIPDRKTPLDMMIGLGAVESDEGVTDQVDIGVDGDYVVTISRSVEGLVIQVWSAVYPVVEAKDLIAEIRTLDSELPDVWNPGGRW